MSGAAPAGPSGSFAQGALLLLLSLTSLGGPIPLEATAALSRKLAFLFDGDGDDDGDDDTASALLSTTPSRAQLATRWLAMARVAPSVDAAQRCQVMSLVELVTTGESALRRRSLVATCASLLAIETAPSRQRPLAAGATLERLVSSHLAPPPVRYRFGAVGEALPGDLPDGWLVGLEPGTRSQLASGVRSTVSLSLAKRRHLLTRSLRPSQARKLIDIFTEERQRFEQLDASHLGQLYRLELGHAIDWHCLLAAATRHPNIARRTSLG